MKKYVETEIKNLRHQLDGMQCGSCHHDTVVRLLPIIRAGKFYAVLRPCKTDRDEHRHYQTVDL